MPALPVHLLRARWLAPIDRPIAEDGAVLILPGATEAIGTGDEIARRANETYPRLPLELHDYGDAIILPGLVNAHTHLELSHLRPPQTAARFTEWLTTVMASPAPSTAESVLAGAAESVRFGVTVVGDISRDPVAARAALKQSPLRARSYGEVVGMAGRREGLEARIAAAIGSPADRSWNVEPGISPHAPYSIDGAGYLRCLAEARRYAMPLTTHLAESPDEAAFLAGHAGPFRDLWDRIGGWDERKVPRFEGGPVRYAQSLHLLGYERTLLAHVNYCDDAEMDLLQRGRASVVYCPRTHAYFGHPPHRWRDMLAAGINVCVGTDGRGSAPDLNLVEDLRQMHRDAPEVAPQTLWELATVAGARALDLLGGGPVMRTASGGSCVVYPVKTNDPLREVLENNVSPLAVWAAGREAFSAAR